MTKRTRGRKSKLTPELQEKFLGLIRDGNYVATACAACGVSERTYYSWVGAADEAQAKVERGEKLAAGEREFLHFLQSVKKAEALALVDSVAHIKTAADEGTWQAAAWYLERRAPEQWGRKRLEVSGPNGGPVEIKTVTELTDEQLAAIAAQSK